VAGNQGFYDPKASISLFSGKNEKNLISVIAAYAVGLSGFVGKSPNTYQSNPTGQIKFQDLNTITLQTNNYFVKHCVVRVLDRSLRREK